MGKLMHILPFMEREELKELALKIINGEVEGVKIHILFPFLSSDDLDEVIDVMIEKNHRGLKHVMPFASKAKVKAISEGIRSGKITGIKEYYLYPFLEKDELKNMFDALVKEAAESKESDHDDDEDDLDDLDHLDDQDEEK